MPDNMTILPLTKPVFNGEEIRLLQECLNSGWVTQGPMTGQFETLMAQRHEVKYALAATSCTAALHLSMLALGIGPGDEVIVPAFTWVTSAHCAEYVGAKAVFADINLKTYNLDPALFKAAITLKTKAVVVVHLFGLAAEMAEILAIASRHSIRVIEDAACAIGTTYDNKPVGGFGDSGCFSFHPRKVITTGEGGMVTTNTGEIAEKVRIFRNHGASGYPGPAASNQKPYVMGLFDYLGFNLRLSDIQSAVGIAQLKKLDALLTERKMLALRYTELLNEVEEIIPPSSPGKCGHTYQSYVIRLVKDGRNARNKIMDFLADSGIQTRPGTHAVHRLGYYVNKYKIKPERFPNASTAEDTTITLPLFHGMIEKDQVFVVNTLKDAIVR